MSIYRTLEKPIIAAVNGVAAGAAQRAGGGGLRVRAGAVRSRAKGKGDEGDGVGGKAVFAECG